MSKILVILFIPFFLYACATSNANIPAKDLSGLEENKANITSSDPPHPEWFTSEDYENFDYIIKNSEMSASKNLAKAKNLLIAEILLANKIQKEFMSLVDQKNILKSIRNASSESEVNKYKNNNYVNKIISGYTLVKSESIKYETGYINYIYIKKIKK